MATSLGYTPIPAQLVVTWGADWICAITDQGVTWPDGTACWVRVAGVDYPATVDTQASAGSTAAFRVESEVCDLWEQGDTFTIYLQFPGTPTLEYGWFAGRVKRKDGATE